MTLSFTELTAIYAKVQLGDNRRPIDDVLAKEWMDTLARGGVEYMDAVAAVTEFRATKPGVFLEPGHIVQIARRLRQDRAEAAHHQQLASSVKAGHPAPLNSEAMTRAYRAHDLAYEAMLADRTPETQAALDAAYGEVCAEEAAYNRQLMDAGHPPVQNPIPVYGMPTRGGLWS
jgi:hypothetical protein